MTAADDLKTLDETLRRLRKRLNRCERLMGDLIAAHDTGEMGMFQEAIENIRKYLTKL